MDQQPRMSDLLDEAEEPAAGPPEVDLDDDFGPPAGRRRWPRITLTLLAGIGLAGAFTGGVAVQKHATATANAGAAVPSFPAGIPSGGFPGLGGASGGTTSAGGTTSVVPVVVGTVVAVDGTEVTVKDLGGTTHTIRTSAATKVTSQQTVKLTHLASGQSVRVTGTKATDGSVDATGLSAQ